MAINTKFVEAEFDYVKPASLDEALDILAEKKRKQRSTPAELTCSFI